MEFLLWLEQTSFSSWMRESPSVWAYPTILFLHTLGLGLLVGASMVIDLRILGFSPSLPIQSLKKAVPVVWFGFWLNAGSGVLLVMIDAVSLLSNPVFYFKLGFIALAMLTGRLIATRVLPEPAFALGKVLAAASLVFWLGAITAGRLTAYIFTGADLAVWNR
jgi:hypothetical protein